MIVYRGDIFGRHFLLVGFFGEGFYGRYADVPMVHLSGWYDPYARTATDNYVGLSRSKRGTWAYFRLVPGALDAVSGFFAAA